MKLRMDLISSAAAYREIGFRVSQQPVEDTFDKLLNGTFSYQDVPLLRIPYEIVKSIDRNIKKGITERVKQAQTRRKIFMSLIISRMVRFELICMDLLIEEGLSLEEFKKEYEHHYHGSNFIVEAITNNKPIQKRVIDLAKKGKLVKIHTSPKIQELETMLSQLENTTGKNLFRQYIDTKNIQKLKYDIVKEKEDSFMSSGQFVIEDICYAIINGTEQTPNPIDLKTVESNTLFKRIWKLSPTAQRKLIEAIVNTYKTTHAKAITVERSRKTKERKQQWSRNNNKKELSAQDKRAIVKEGKANGLSKKELSLKIGCNLRLVQKYWNTSD